MSRTLLSIFRLCIVSLPILGLFSGSTQAREQGIPGIRNFTSRQYSAYENNSAGIQDQRGLIYVANTAGILEYDGTSWRRIETGGNAIPRSFALSPKDGRLYVGCRNEFGYLAPASGGTYKYKSLASAIKPAERQIGDVNKTVVDANQAVYFIAQKAVAVFSAGKTTILTPPRQISSGFLLEGRVIVHLVDSGLFVVNNQRFELIEGSSALPKGLEIRSLLRAKDNSYLLSTRANGIFRLAGNEWREVQWQVSPLLRELRVSDMVRLPNGEYAVGTARGGLLIVSETGDLLLKVSIREGLINETVQSIWLDSEQGIWLALDNGLARVDYPSTLTYFSESNGVVGGVAAVARYQGFLYLGTGTGLYRFRSDTRVFESVPGAPGAVSTLVPVSEGLLVGTSEGLGILQAGVFSLIHSDFTFDVVRLANNPDVLISTGLYGVTIVERRGGRWTNMGRSPLVSGQVTDCLSKPDGSIWLNVADRGVWRTTLQELRLPTGKYSSLMVGGKALPSIGSQFAYVGQDAIVTSPQGIFYLEEPARPFEKFAVGKDASPWLSYVISTSDGLVVAVNGEKKGASIFGATGTGKYTARGTPLLPVADFRVQVLYADPDGSIWLGGPDGAVRYDPTVERNYKTPFNALIREVQVKNDSVQFAGTFAQDSRAVLTQPPTMVPLFKYNQNVVTFTFGATSFFADQGLEFQYFLEGFDPDSSAWVKEFRKEYTNLPSGIFTFNVRARNVYGELSAVSKYRFEIQIPWFQSWWAVTLYVLISGLIVYLVIRWRVQISEREKRKLEQIIEERTGEVVRQKEEIEEKTSELADKNDEMAKINLMVKAINAEIDFEKLLQTILEKMNILVRTVEKSAVLVLDPSSHTYEYKAMVGYPDPPLSDDLSPEEMERKLTSGAFEVYEDVFVREDESGDTVVMVVRVGGQTEGYLLLENSGRLKKFSDTDLSLFNSLKEHVISAFIKTKILSDVQEKNRQVEILNEVAQSRLRAIQKDLDTASKIQHAILPDWKGFKKGKSGFDICGEMIAAKSVGGDFYDFFEIDADRIGFVIADVSGKGMPAALFMAVSRTMLKSTALQGYSPGEALGIVNNLLCVENVSTLFVTVFYGIIDVRDGTVTYGNGGHNLPFVLRSSGSVEMLKKTKGMGLAIMDDMEFATATLTLAKGDYFFLYTDGVTEAMDPSDELYSDERLSATLTQLTSSSTNAVEIMQGVIADVKGFAAQAPQSDDITVLIIQYLGR